mgnify:FL=1
MQSKIEALKSILSSLDIPVAYNHFNVETKLPYICFLEDTSDNTFADNKVYYENSIIMIELYTEYKNMALENSLKTLLNNNEIPYEKTMETYMDDERMYEVVYTILL